MIAGIESEIEIVKVEDFEAAWELFYGFRDKDWSFTDCVSFIVMERLGISSAFAFDDHFRQYGRFTVVP